MVTQIFSERILYKCCIANIFYKTCNLFKIGFKVSNNWIEFLPVAKKSIYILMKIYKKLIKKIFGEIFASEIQKAEQRILDFFLIQQNY